MNPNSSRQSLLRRRPQSQVGRDDLELASSAVPAPRKDDVLVRVKLLCMDPTSRNFIDPDPGYNVGVRTGFENVPDTFNCLFTGAHTGRLVAQID